MTTLFLTFTTELAANTALAQINSNCGFPNEACQTWDIVKKAYEQDLWFFVEPPANGYTSSGLSYTYEEMMEGVTDYAESEWQASWFPPEPEE